MIAILGGTFDPPHKAHLKIADYCLKNIPLEKIIFIPCYLPVLKKRPQISANHRLAMIEAAIAKNPKLSIDEREIKRKEASYTIDTLHSIRQDIGKNISLCFIMGGDAFKQFLDWKDWQGILKSCHLIIMKRPGYVLNDNLKLMQILEKHKAETAEELLKTSSGKILICAMPEMAISSTALREELDKNPAAVKSKLPPAVWEYIAKHSLY